MSDPRLDAIRGIQRRADDVRDRSYAAAEWCDVRFLLAELERVTAAQTRVRYILENIADPYNERIGPLKVWANEALAILAARGGDA
jgi:hypothetical protein